MRKVADAKLCNATKRVFVDRDRQKSMRLVCELPADHNDAPLFGGTVTHHDLVYGISWKGKKK